MASGQWVENGSQLGLSSEILAESTQKGFTKEIHHHGHLRPKS